MRCSGCFLLLWLLVAFQHLALAQSQEEQTVDRQLQNYEVKFKKMMATRGIDYREGAVDNRKIRQVIIEYGTDLYGDVSPDVALLFYHFENDTLFHWLFDHRGVVARSRLPVTIDSLIALENTVKFNVYIDNRVGDLPEDIRGQYRATEKKYRLRTHQTLPLISRLLFPEVIAKPLREKKFLLVLPVLNLSNFPFAMLQPWGKGEYLIDRLAFSFAHNFTQFFTSVNAEALSNYRLSTSAGVFALRQPVVVGNPAFADPCTRNLPPLRGAEQEALHAAGIVGAQAATGYRVQRGRILQLMEQSNFIYLATHGWADTEHPLDKSYIAFYDSGGCGFVSPRVIQGLSLRHQPLVVLSACQSGLGGIHDAGIVGLARGFLKAGAQSVTMSLWNVDDAQTAVVMKLFLEELQKPHKFFPAEHFRQAVLQYRRQHKKDPNYWAAFQNFGVPTRLATEFSMATPAK